jgi:hypothetical protein
MFLRVDKEREFWKAFRRRVAISLTGKPLVPVTVYVPPESIGWIPPFLQNHADDLVAEPIPRGKTFSTSVQAARVLNNRAQLCSSSFGLGS